MRRRPERALKTAYALCQQMMHVFHQFRLYVTFEVLEPAWLNMQQRLDAAATLDEATLHPIHLSRPACSVILGNCCMLCLMESGAWLAWGGTPNRHAIPEDDPLTRCTCAC